MDGSFNCECQSGFAGDGKTCIGRLRIQACCNNIHYKDHLCMTKACRYSRGAHVMLNKLLLYFRFFSFVFFITFWHIYVLYLHLADLLKTNLTEFAVIWVKTRRQKAGFLRQRSSKITVTMRRKGEAREQEREEREKRRREKKSMVALLVFAGKNCWKQKVHVHEACTRNQLLFWNKDAFQK